MSKRSPKSIEEKLEILYLLLNQKQSPSQLSKQYNVTAQTIKFWKMKYEMYGIDGLNESRTWKDYSSELREQAVQDYLAAKGSLREICSHYHISDQSVLRRWLKQYTNGKELKIKCRGRRRMNKGRKTTFEERLEIVNFTIAHEKDYQLAIEKFGVSYQQVYSWVRKFENGGSQALVDRRGKGLETKQHLSETEKLQLKVKQLEERNRYLEMENGLLKKLKEIEQQNRH